MNSMTKAERAASSTKQRSASERNTEIVVVSAAIVFRSAFLLLSLFSSADVGVWRQSPRCRGQVWSCDVRKVNKRSSSLPSQVDWLTG